MDALFDTIVVGGGPAGLSAALVLGRCRRRVLVLDAGHPRNESSMAVHGFFSRDGTPPAELLRIGREQLAPYDVSLREAEVKRALRDGREFEVEKVQGERFRSRTLLLATGLTDHLPDLPGFDRFYGIGVVHCPYCDGWEARDLPMVALSRGTAGIKFALGLLTWSRSVVLCTDGCLAITQEERAVLDRNGVHLETGKIHALEGEADQLERVRFTDGSTLPCRRLFFKLGMSPRSSLASGLGCRMDEAGQVLVGDYNQGEGEGLYVAGDACRDLKFVVMAAADGARAAFDINERLQSRDLV